MLVEAVISRENLYYKKVHNKYYVPDCPDSRSEMERMFEIERIEPGGQAKFE